MKKKFLPFVVIILMFFVALIVSYLIATNNEMADLDKVVSRVYKSEFSNQATNEEIAEILVERMMDKHQFRSLNWYEWVWTYEIKEIELEHGFDKAVNVDIYVKPLFPDAWSDVWTFEVDRVSGGWVRVGYFMVIDDKGDYYELRGPFSGG